ncbi:transporter substrate-binding domain-containing protein [Rhizobium sp. ICMP 5592]|uniref:transporter substrate-binding domain-containing protein n=1 Tax=Rhizobium sp. ICMP 5592 TaxID=2292445 RepID=UPI001886A642|nr:transporter substrate-binding domain-containing protein [Rhizobium sp. ICMP 5592]
MSMKCFLSVLAMATGISCLLPLDGAFAATVQGIEIKADPALAAKVPKSWVPDGVLRAPVMQAPPTGVVLDDGTVTGFVPDLVGAIAAKLDLKHEMEATSFDAQVPGAVSGRYAMTTDTGDFPKRREILTMIDYLKSGTAFVTLASNPKKIGKMEDMCGLRIGVIKGTVQEYDIETFGKECVAKGLAAPTTDAAGSTILTVPLQADRVDVVWDSINAYIGYSASEPGAYTMPVPPFFSAYVALGVPVGQPEAAKLVKDTLQSLIDDGTYGKLLAHWKLTDIGVDKVTSNSDIVVAK